MTKIAITAEFPHGTLHCELEPSPLGLRWWTFTDYDGILGGDYVRDYFVLPLRYVTDLNGAERLLCATEDARLFLTGNFALFPVLDDDIAGDGVLDLFAQVTRIYAVQPALF